jgi:hypothetical protein
MNEPLKRRALALATATALGLLACSKKAAPPSEKQVAASAPSAAAATAPANAASYVIQSKDEVCTLLASSEVSAELKQSVLPARQQRITLDAPPECLYPTSDAPDAMGVVVKLFFQQNSTDAPAAFSHIAIGTCGHEAQQPVAGLGDEAVLCGKLLVRKGNNFFILSRQNGDPALPWADSAKRLAEKAVTRLP